MTQAAEAQYPDAVEKAHQTLGESNAQPVDGSLPDTGAELAEVGGIGLVLVALGACLYAIVKRRDRT